VSSHSTNIQSSIEIPIKHEEAARTLIDTLTQRHLVPMSTLTACLARVGRIDRNVRAPSFFRFGCKLVEELRPRGICNAFGKTMGVRHAGDRQVVHTDDAKTINDLARLLVGEIVTPEGNPFVYTSDHLAMLPALRCPFRKFGMRALGLVPMPSLPDEKSAALAMASPVESVAKVVSPTSMPTWVSRGSRRWGSHSTEKHTYHLPVLLLWMVQVLIVPLMGR